MTVIRIAPAEVKRVGLQAVSGGDDVQAAASQLRSVATPPMPAATAAELEGSLSAVASRLTAAAQAMGTAGAELQVRAAAAEAADAPGPAASAGAGSTLARSITTTATVVRAGGVTETATVKVGPGGIQATTQSGLKVTMPELARGAEGSGGADVMSNAAEPPDPHAAAAAQPAAARDTSAGQPVEGPPAAAVQQAVAAPAHGGGGAAGSTGGGFSADAVLGGDSVDPTIPGAAGHGAAHEVTGVPVPTHMPQDPDASRQDWACWMAGSAAHHGLPPALPVMMALAGSGLRNAELGSHDVGFFGLDPARTYAPAGQGHVRDIPADGDWWISRPEAQLDEVVGRLRDSGGGIREAGLDDPEALSRWANEAAPQIDPAQLADAHAAATTLIDHCKHTAGVPAGASGGALGIAKSQLGVHEVGTNAGPKVNGYLASAGVSSGNPWCASFVNWSMQQAGHEMPGTGWAAVANWVHAAETGQHGLHFVDAAHARPGDIVAYDWGGDHDFTSDGHIGFLNSPVVDGHFTAVEGNAQDAVTQMDRNTGMGNVVFIRPGA